MKLKQNSNKIDTKGIKHIEVAKNHTLKWNWYINLWNRKYE